MNSVMGDNMLPDVNILMAHMNNLSVPNRMGTEIIFGGFDIDEEDTYVMVRFP